MNSLYSSDESVEEDGPGLPERKTPGIRLVMLDSLLVAFKVQFGMGSGWDSDGIRDGSGFPKGTTAPLSVRVVESGSGAVLPRPGGEVWGTQMVVLGRGSEVEWDATGGVGRCSEVHACVACTHG